MDEAIARMFDTGVKGGGDSVLPKAVGPERASEFVQAELARTDADAPMSTPMTNLANRVMTWFRTNYDFRNSSGVTARLDYCIRAVTCEFSAEQRDKMQKMFPPEVGDKLFAPITSTKVRAAKSMLVDLSNQSGEPLFHVEPTPVPSVPMEVQLEAMQSVMAEITQFFAQLQQAGVQQIPPDVMMRLQRLIAMVTVKRKDDIEAYKDSFARDCAKRLEKKIWDTMVEGGFEDEFWKVMDFVCTYGTGVMIGPFEKTVAKNRCFDKKSKEGTKYAREYRRVYRKIPCYEAVNPMDCYPAPDAHEIGDGPFCITVKYTGDDLWRMANAKSGRKNENGWMQDAVRDTLARHPNGGVHINIVSYDTDRRTCENNGFEDTHDCTFEGVRCFASIRGSELATIGITKDTKGGQIDISKFYNTETIVIDNRVVYCRIYDDVVGVPVSKCVFYEVPGSWWGESIADKVAMCQVTLNNAIKSIMVNIASSSSSIIWVNGVDRLTNKSPDALKLRAGMTVGFTNSMMGNTGAPMGALTIPSVVNELLALWQRMQAQADLDSGLPSYTEGQTAGQGGALRTSSGLQTFVAQQMRGMKMVMNTIDNGLIRKVARMTADYLLVNDDDMSIKGDVEIRSVGLIGKVMKTQRDSNRLQIFNMVVQNQFLLQLFGAKGIVALFRPSLEDVDINPDDCLPSKGKLEEMEAIQGIKQVFEATAAAQGVQQNALTAVQQGAAPQGIEKPEQIQSNVAERRAVA